VTLGADFYTRSVHAVAEDLVGCVVRHGATAGRIVEVESYHQSEPACHAFAGLTPRTGTLFGPPGRAYVYRSYGVHALLNAVAETEGVGAAVLIRALEPVDGLEEMRSRRGVARDEQLCSGPAKLTQALGIGLELNGSSLLDGPIRIEPRGDGARPRVVRGERIGITKAVDLPWRFCDADSRHVSRPHPPDMRLVARRAHSAA
jgi:DNA-3-methyladenine glycosylase